MDRGDIPTGGAPDNNPNAQPQIFSTDQTSQDKQSISSKLGTSRSRFNSRANRYAEQQTSFSAAQSIAQNQNTPQFFSDAVMANTPAPVEPPKKSKKPLFIGLGVAAVAIIAVVAVVAFIPSIGQEEGGDGTISQKTKNLYYSFANYILYGEDKTDEFTEEYEYGSKYHYATLDDDKREAYIKTSIEKFDAFKESYEKDNVEDDELSAKIDGYQKNLDLFLYIEKYPIISGSALLSAYVEKGKDETEKALKDYFDKFEESTFEETKVYGRDYLSRASSLISIYDSLNSAGCIDRDQDVIVGKCLYSQGTPNSTRVDQVQDFANYYNDKLAYEMNLAKNIYRDVWKINEALEDEK